MTLDELTDKLKQLSDPGSSLYKKIHSELGAETLSLIQTCFNSATDPYGVPWAADKRGAHVPLKNTGALEHGFSTTDNPDGFSVKNTQDYAEVHQTGGLFIPARPFVPDDNRGIPNKWQENFSQIMGQILTEHFEGTQ